MCSLPAAKEEVQQRKPLLKLHKGPYEPTLHGQDMDKRRSNVYMYIDQRNLRAEHACASPEAQTPKQGPARPAGVVRDAAPAVQVAARQDRVCRVAPRGPRRARRDGPGFELDCGPGRGDVGAAAVG